MHVRALSRPTDSAWILRAAVEAASVDVSIADLTLPDQPLVYVNPAFERTTGYRAAEAVGRNCRFLQGPEADPAVVAAMRAAIAARRGGSFELVNRRRDGTPFLNRVELAPVADPATGEVTAYIGIQTDITRFREAEAARREREKLEALGRMAGGFAHEVNNLLQPVLTYAGLIEARLAPMGGELAEEATILLESARATADVARRILGFARFRRAEAGPQPLGSLVADAAALAGRLLPVGVALDLPPDLAAFEGRAALDPTELLQVLGNLLRNAADAIGAGRGGRVTLALAPDGPGFARLTLADTGCGMDAATRARAFEPFFTTKPAGAGTGLGLATVWSLVRGWGGEIRLESAPGAGTAFHIRIPLDPPDTTTDHPGAP